MKCLACESENLQNFPGVFADFVAARTGVDSVTTWSHCADCGLSWVDYRFTEAESNALYEGYRDDLYVMERNSFEPGYIEIHQQVIEPRPYRPEIEGMIREWIEPQTGLDIGAGDGINHPFPDIDYTMIDLGDAWPEGTFDLVVMQHLLEHVTDPKQLVTDAKAKVAPGGVLFFEVPIEEDSQIWHEHIQRFTPQALRALLPFNQVEIRAVLCDPGTILVGMARD